jgi:hypothetical protein
MLFASYTPGNKPKFLRKKKNKTLFHSTDGFFTFQFSSPLEDLGFQSLVLIQRKQKREREGGAGRRSAGKEKKILTRARCM